MTLLLGYVLVCPHHCVVYLEKLLFRTLILFTFRVSAARAIIFIELVLVKANSCYFEQHTTIHRVIYRVKAFKHRFNSFIGCRFFSCSILHLLSFCDLVIRNHILVAVIKSGPLPLEKFYSL